MMLFTGILFIFVLLMYLLPLLLEILRVVEYWFIFKNAGYEGWESLIPFYNDYIRCKVAKNKNLFWYRLGAGIACVVGNIIFALVSYCCFTQTHVIGPVAYSVNNGPSVGMTFAWALFNIAVSAVLIVVAVKYSIAMAKAFKQPTSFGVGLFFLEPVFAGILAFNKNMTYHNDVVEPRKEAFNEEHSAEKNEENSVEPDSCPEDVSDKIVEETQPEPEVEHASVACESDVNCDEDVAQKENEEKE